MGPDPTVLPPSSPLKSSERQVLEAQGPCDSTWKETPFNPCPVELEFFSWPSVCICYLVVDILGMQRFWDIVCFEFVVYFMQLSVTSK